MKTYVVSWRENPDGEVKRTTVEAEHAREAAQQANPGALAGTVVSVEPEDKSEPVKQFGGHYGGGGQT